MFYTYCSESLMKVAKVRADSIDRTIFVAGESPFERDSEIFRILLEVLQRRWEQNSQCRIWEVSAGNQI